MELMFTKYITLDQYMVIIYDQFHKQSQLNTSTWINIGELTQGKSDCYYMLAVNNI